MTEQDFNIRVIEELSGVRGDIRELMATMKHIDSKIERTNEDMKEVKAMATEASSEAESANTKADKALIELDETRKDVDRLFEKARESEKESRNARRWAISTSIPVLAIVVTIIIALIGG